MSIFAIIGLSMVGISMSILLKQHKPEYSLLVTLMTGIIILMWATVNLIPAIEQFISLLNKTNIPAEYGGIIFKSLGIAFVTELASDTCKDAGGSAISTKLELAGKVAILIISLPLFEKILSIAMDMIVTH